MSAGMEKATSKRVIWGVLAEFPGPQPLLSACEVLRDEGFTRWDAHTPFPVHGLNDAMGIRPTRLPWLVFGAGSIGAVGALVMQWWMNAVDYPIIISGKPLWSLPANIPVTFELMVLLAALTAFFGMLVFNGLPRWHHPLFRNPTFGRSTADRFFISVEAADPKFDPAQTEALLRRLGGTAVEWIEG